MKQPKNCAPSPRANGARSEGAGRRTSGKAGMAGASDAPDASDMPGASDAAGNPRKPASPASRRPSSRAIVCGMPRGKFVAQAGTIAALYAAATLVTIMLLQGLAWGPVQFRISEALCVVAVLTPAAVPGLTVGCVLANLIALVINGTGALGMLDVAFGSLATLAGALWCRKLRERPKLALLGPVLANALIVPAYLPLLLQGLGYYTIPFTSISIDGAYLPMYLFGAVATGLGEALVVYALGLPLLSALRKANIGK